VGGQPGLHSKFKPPWNTWQDSISKKQINKQKLGESHMFCILVFPFHSIKFFCFVLFFCSFSNQFQGPAQALHHCVTSLVMPQLLLLSYLEVCFFFKQIFWDFFRHFSDIDFYFYSIMTREDTCVI
jgi:hypothetical protein